MWEIDTFNDLLEAFVAVTLCLWAMWRFGLAFWTYQADPIKQAKRYGMTEGMVQRSNLIILIYAFFLFYEAQLSLFQQPGPTPWKVALDGMITLGFVVWATTVFFLNLTELHRRAGLGGASPDKVRHLSTVLKKRDLSLVEFSFAPILVGIKYYATGAFEVVRSHMPTLF